MISLNVCTETFNADLFSPFISAREGVGDTSYRQVGVGLANVFQAGLCSALNMLARPECKHVVWVGVWCVGVDVGVMCDVWVWVWVWVWVLHKPIAASILHV